MSGHLSIAAAAERVHRKRRTIERWIADGDLEVTAVMNDKGRVIRRYVEIGHLLKVYRAKLAADPTRAKIRDDDTPP